MAEAELAEVNARIARLTEEVAVDPPFVERLTNPTDHGAYLEHAHESTLRSLAVIHLRLARGDVEGATALVASLRAHLDKLWEQRKQAAVREVKP